MVDHISCSTMSNCYACGNTVEAAVLQINGGLCGACLQSKMEDRCRVCDYPASGDGVAWRVCRGLCDNCNRERLGLPPIRFQAATPSSWEQWDAEDEFEMDDSEPELPPSNTVPLFDPPQALLVGDEMLYGSIVVVKTHFNATEYGPQCLICKVGDTLGVLSDNVDRGWVYGYSISTGAIGWFPQDFVRRPPEEF